MFDPSSIILFVGAACILAFIIHGLWFSDRPKNRKLEKDGRVLIIPYHRKELAKGTWERIKRDAGWSEP